jgi:hypothetical protein
MKRLEDNINNPGGKNTFSPLQMFAEEEEEKQAKARDEEELQMKSEEEELQTKEEPGSSGTKTDMPDDVQNKMEYSFGVDFSDVDIHKDSPQAPSLGALAYTQGNDVHFAPGQYNPGSQKGQELLGHELTHVVQQREGRVKPTNKQQSSYAKASEVNEGMSVNTDPALEKEADEQGKQAAQGKMADVKGKGSGVQRQGGDEYVPNDDTSSKDIVISDGGWFGDDVIAENMKEHGSKTWEKMWSGEHKELYLTGSKEGWSKILEYVYDPRMRELYLTGFLKAATIDGWAEKRGMKPPTDDEIIDFLRALYSEGVNTDLNFSSKKTEPRYNNGMMMTVNKDSEYISQGKTNEMIAQLIKKHQHIFIKEISGSDNSDLSTTGGIKKLAEEGTTTEEANNKNPMIVKAMIQNAYAHALSNAKYLIKAVVNEEGFSVDEIENCGIIVGEAIAGYEGKLQGLKEATKNAFEILWSGIDIDIPGIGLILEAGKKGILYSINNSKSFKNESLNANVFGEDFDDALDKMKKEIEDYDGIKATLLSLFEGQAVNTFKRGLNK